ncbi:MAG: hypothetical protein CL844_03985 [Crocinitomicaceae bacterium]|nr:hypothetical protein [Crocinitomicaceae bacterium]|tara:strand:+ start:6247 stop:7110 length:864 start_codon:yes stop_codon:yes gene_type:complete
MKYKNVFLFTFLFLLSSCVIYYNSNDIRNDFKVIKNKAVFNFSNIENDYNNKSNIIEELSDNVIDVNINPINSILSEKTILDKNFIDIKSSKDKVVSLYMRIERITREKEKIKSDDKSWDALKNIKKEMKTEIDKINVMSENYSISSNKIIELLNNSSFNQIDRAEFINTINKNYNSLVESLSVMEKNTNNYNYKLEQAKKNNSINDSIYVSKSNILSEIFGLKDSINVRTDKLSTLKDSLNNQTENLSKIWIGDNTKLNKMYSDFKNIIQLINNDYNRLISQINVN